MKADQGAERARRKAQLESDARDAWERGQHALSAGDLADAERWLDRAARLAAGDRLVQVMLASLRLRRGHPDAAAEFEEIAKSHGDRAAWLGLAAAHHLAGRANAAADALHMAFARHAAPPDADVAVLADRISDAVGAAGWCYLSPDFDVIARTKRAPSVELNAEDVDSVRISSRAGSCESSVPPRMRSANALHMTALGAGLIGSPIELARIRRVEGFVTYRDGMLEGWAWQPGSPETAPSLHIEPFGLTVVARDPALDVRLESPSARPRRFSVAIGKTEATLISVTTHDGRHLAGSPLNPALFAPPGNALSRNGVRMIGPFAASSSAKRVPEAASHGISVVIPVHDHRDVALPCLRSVLRTVPKQTTIVVVDDASADAVLTLALDRLAAARRIKLIRHPDAKGFPASANAGMRAAGKHDIVLLNSDTLVSPRWLERLRAAAYAVRDTGTATPLSNDATILSYPNEGGENEVPNASASQRLAALAWRANRNAIAEIPTAVGFCMYIKRECIDDIGLLREDAFAQGYGEENDFCMRAHKRGWRHVAALGCFIGHVGGGSFGAMRGYLALRNQQILEHLHPGYRALVETWRSADPLLPARRRMDTVRLQSHCNDVPSVLLVAHSQGGGVQKYVERRIAALRRQGLQALTLYPAEAADEECACILGTGFNGAYPNLRFAMPAETPELARLLVALKVQRAEVHHMLGHSRAIMDLIGEISVPYDFYVHDYAAFCPRISLIGLERRYCGEPDVAACERCIAEAGSNIDEEIGIQALRSRSAGDLLRARRVVAPSADTAARINRHFPKVRPVVSRWEKDSALPKPMPFIAHPERVICVIGAIGVEKGYDVLLAAARDASARKLPLRFVVVGYTGDDARLLATGRVFVTGQYRDEEAGRLIADQAPTLAWIPSVWPETWCFALTQAWRAGLYVAAFDLGAQAERIRRTGRGFVLPLGIASGAINAALLSWTPPMRRQAENGFSEAENHLNTQSAQRRCATATRSKITC